MPAGRYTHTHSGGKASPKQRRRRTIFRIATTAAILTLLTCVASGWWTTGWISKPSSSGQGFSLIITQGWFVLESSNIQTLIRNRTGFVLEQHPMHWRSLPGADFLPGYSWVALPLWIPFLAFTIAAYITRPRKLHGTSCQNCGYNLVGLDKNTCPECGHTNHAISTTTATTPTTHRKANTPCESSTSPQD